MSKNAIHTRHAIRYSFFVASSFIFDMFRPVIGHLRFTRRCGWRLYSHVYIAHLPQQCHNSKCVIFQERLLKVLKCYNFLWVQRRHNCSTAASFVNCVMTLYMLKVHLQTFLSIPINQKCQILSCDTLVANERYVNMNPFGIIPFIYTDDFPKEAYRNWKLIKNLSYGVHWWYFIEYY
jgi:hypothetical protein